MYYTFTTLNSSLEELAQAKERIGNFYITFSQFGDLKKTQPIYSISNGLQTIVALKWANYSWRILHSEAAGKRVTFLGKDDSLLLGFKKALESFDSEYSIEVNCVE